MQNGPPSDLLVAWPRLAGELQRRRQAARLTTRQLAERLGVSQSKVTKVENARTVPSVEDVQAWAEATNTPAEQTARLAALVQQAQTEAIILRAARRAGLPDLQRRAAASERTATTIRVYYPTIIPGLLQTPDYARLVVTAGYADRPDVDEAISQRMQRQAILYEEGRRFEFVMGEAALRWRYGPLSVQLGQLDRLRTAAMLANVQVGILPLARPTPAWHSHGFTLFEDRLDGKDPFVHVETLTAPLNLSDPADVAEYQQTLARLRELAAYGEGAQALLVRLMDEFRHATS